MSFRLYYDHEGFARSNDLEAALRRVTSANIKASAARFLDEKNLIVGILRRRPTPRRRSTRASRSEPS